LTGCNKEDDKFKELDNMTAGVEPLTYEDYIARQQKAAMLMEENRIDGLFITAGLIFCIFLTFPGGRVKDCLGQF